MSSHFEPEQMSAEDRKQYGAALVKGAAFDAIYVLWQRRKSQGWTNASIAANVAVDEGWLSKQFAGPRNWTANTMGILIQGLKGIIEIQAIPEEEVAAARTNYDAYAEYETPLERTPAQVPPVRKGTVIGSVDDPSIKNIIEMIRKPNEPAAVPVA